VSRKAEECEFFYPLYITPRRASFTLNFVKIDKYNNSIWDYLAEKKVDDISVGFDTIHECDGQKDTDTGLWRTYRTHTMAYRRAVKTVRMKVPV